MGNNKMYYSQLTKTVEQRKAIAAKGVETRRKNKALREVQEQLKRDKRDHLLVEIEALTKERNDLLLHEHFGELISTIGNKSLLRESEIVQQSSKWGGVSGVYFLIKQDRIVYVGQSVNVFARIGTHQTDKDFDSIAWLPCDKGVLDKLESIYIHTLQPPLNGRLNNGYINAPLALDTLLTAHKQL